MLTNALPLWDCHLQQDSHFMKCHEVQYIHLIESYELANGLLWIQAKLQKLPLSYHQPG